VSKITVYKLDENGRPVWHYPARVLERQANHIRLEAFFNRDDLTLDYITFKRGDRFVETFYTDRWYNVFAVYDRDDGVLKGWYCNVCRPTRVEETAVYCEDLALDVWVGVDREILVLDEEEFAALDLTEGDRKRGETAVKQILSLATKKELPT
jgi:protein associated with RNAse G/E